MPQDKIVIRGAREHNLKNISLEIPRDRLVVITGLSGSGKSSLAFDTLYAEGQRRYVESLSAYARQFLGQMDKPDVDYIEGLSPAISIDQKGTSRNPRSTVGTVTEIYDYLRLLFARIGVPHCPQCGREITQQTVQQIVDAIAALPEGSKIMILAPMIKDRKGEHKGILEEARRSGFVRVRVDGVVRELDEDIELERYKMHTIEAVVDRILLALGENGQDSNTLRITDSVETALRLGEGIVVVSDVTGDEPRDMLFSEHFSCVQCGISLPEIEPRTFSFNSPHGACPTCTGLGVQLEIDPDLVVPDKERSLDGGAIAPWRQTTADEGYYAQLLKATTKHYGIPTNIPVSKLSPRQLDLILYGQRSGETLQVRYKNSEGHMRSFQTTYEGVIPNLERRYRETSSDYIRREIDRYMAPRLCPSCKGKRLKPESLAVTVADLSIVDATAFSVTQALQFFEQLEASLSERQVAIARQILKEIKSRLRFMVDVGLDYLTIDRGTATLSGGEAQRIRLATQIGSQLMGVLYILDEPSIGLHQRDNARLIRTLKEMRDIGNTVIVVEHDEETIRAADYVVDLGPGAGEHGGEVVAAGTLDDVVNCERSITGQFLKGERRVPMPSLRRPGHGQSLVIKGARENNLKDVSVDIPLSKFVCVTGVSGSGKSSLIVEILYKRLSQLFYSAKDRPGLHDAIRGLVYIPMVDNILPAPSGLTPRSNPATYTNVFTSIRDLYASLPEAKMRGYAPGRFSFNVKGGRCEACRGDGIIRIEMQFLPDVYVPCEVCHGKRYNREALEIRYKGKSISEVLDMTVDEALTFFKNLPKIRNKLKTLYDVGLGYIRLGQPATTLSGGEAQRVKLSRELSRRATGRTLYILDEPTTGLHFADIERLLKVLSLLVDAGNSVIVIEHNLDVIKTSDWIIDLGPEGGEKGGYVVAQGTPEEVSRTRGSYTGEFVKRILQREGEAQRVPTLAQEGTAA
jgi:excinuclease ABC subunit A